MPQIIIETSPNVQLAAPKQLLATLNQALFATGHFTPATALKARLYTPAQALVGIEPDDDAGFISVTMYLMPGRDDNVKNLLTQTILQSIEQHVREQETIATQRQLQITANLLDLAPSYQKILL